MSELHFFRDEHGAACATGDDERLAAFLQSDIQDSPEIAEGLLALLQLPQEAEFNGNAYSVSIDPKTVCLSNQFDETAVDRRLSREDFAKALTAWHKFIRSVTD